jgi:predicted alternative tryptophan synthase beta-subunit
MAEMKENTKKVLEYLKKVDGVEEVTAADIAKKLQLGLRQVNGIVTSAFTKKKYAVRIPAEIEDPTTHTHKPISLIRLTDLGRSLDENGNEPSTEAE